MSVYQNAGETSDDEFGDFGGFEAADEMAPTGAQGLPVGLEASPNQWALFPTADGSMNARPDLLCGQNRFPELLDPAVSPAEHDDAGIINPLHDDSDAVNNGLFEVDFNQIQIANNQPALPVDILADNVLGGRVVNAADARLACSPDIRGLDLPIAAANMTAPAVVNGSLAMDRPDLELELEMDSHRLEPEVEEYQDNQEEIDELGAERPVAELDEAAGNNIVQADSLEMSDLRDLLNRTVADKDRLEKELLSVEHLQGKLEECEVKVAFQKQKYEKLQEEHRSNLDAMQKAGHDALAVVVEEYKELCQTTVLEQQEAAHREVLTTVQGECCRLHELLQQQNEKYEKLLDDEKRKMRQTTQELIDDQMTVQQHKFEAFLEEESKKSREALDKAITDEKKLCRKEVELAVQEESEQSRQVLELEREKFSHVLKEECESSSRSLSEAVKNERELSQQILKDALEEERQKHKELVKQALDVAKEEMQSYIKEQKKLDSTVRKRQFATLDLFLESARHQLNMLMNSADQESIEDKPPND